ncbi:hypothetical protein BH10BAC2_BH10BAC2_06540 [soil metagenome]
MKTLILNPITHCVSLFFNPIPQTSSSIQITVQKTLVYKLRQSLSINSLSTWSFMCVMHMLQMDNIALFICNQNCSRKKINS